MGVRNGNNSEHWLRRLVICEAIGNAVGGGDYNPVLLLPAGTAPKSLKAAWPVVGILFERPS